MTNLSALLERVTAATGPDRRIDRELSVLPGGPNWRHLADGHAAYFRRLDKGEDGRTYAFASGPDSEDFATDLNENAWPNYTSSVDAALALTEQALPGWMWSAGNVGPNHTHWACVTELEGECRDFDAGAPSAPLAIIAAVLAALIAKGTQP